MDKYTNENDSINSERLFFKINNKQVVFKTDKRTVEKLNDGTFRNTKCLFFLAVIFINYLVLSFQKANCKINSD